MKSFIIREINNSEQHSFIGGDEGRECTYQVYEGDTYTHGYGSNETTCDYSTHGDFVSSC